MAEKTLYNVLRRNDTTEGDERFELFAENIPANNAEEAIRKACETEAAKPGGWGSGWCVAVPSRSWNVTPVTATQTTVVKVGGPAT